ncbi:MAG: RNA polymerase factor sigma-54 [Deltaproteobacteria bacterium]|nr:RNA polymerase factor sigma-54 [Deltaproteobacteria bacterium]
MGYELKQELRLTQKLLLTPQLRLAIKLLQLTRQELVDTVREELEKNPVLEETGGAEETAEASTVPEAKLEPQWQDYIEASGEYGGRPRLDFSERDDTDFYEKAQPTGTSLREHLLWQLSCSHLSGNEKKIGEFIIGNIDEGGYLRLLEKGALDEETYKNRTVEEISELIGVDAAETSAVLEFIQELDPPGVGARTTRECLYLQARRLPERNAVVEEIILKHLDLLAGKNYRAISKEMGIPVEGVVEAAGVITGSLKPVPGAGFGTDEARVIIPDAYIEKVDGEYVVLLNEDGMPKLRISPYYKKMLAGDGASKAKGYIEERLKAALWLIKSVHQRQKTLKRVVESIVAFQREFFDMGLKYLRPLVLKDVADDIGMHESTVSRVTANKYAQTPRGVFALKYFFSSGMNSSDGSDVTVEYIKEKIKSFIEGEDCENPLSDQQIAERLRESLVAIARRTVAKYREELGLQPSNRRKSHY